MKGDKNMSKIQFEIFKKAFNEIGLNKAELGRILEVKPNALQGWFDRKSVPSKYLYPIAEALQVNPKYLIGETDDKTRMQRIPIIGNQSSAVPSMPVVIEGCKLLERYYFGDNVYGIFVDCNMMSPTINPNSICLCDPDTKVKENDIVHYSWGDQNGIARHRLSADGQTIVLAPDNKDFDPVVIRWDSEIKLKMVKIFRVEQDL